MPSLTVAPPRGEVPFQLDLRGMRRDGLNHVINHSINQTLGRTVLTAGTTLLSAVALFVFGGEVINHFAFAMVVGIIVGTYSSIAIAAPLVLVYTNIRGRSVPQTASPARAAVGKVPKPKRA